MAGQGSIPEEKKLRLFAALELPREWHEVLARARAELDRVAAGELRWVRPELMHLTLLFLGYQPPDLLPGIEAEMSAAASQVPPFRLSLGRVGCFGQPHSIHVLWVGLSQTPPDLQRLHQALDAHLSDRGVTFDRRPLVAHITLARARRPIDKAASLRIHAALQRLAIPPGLTMEVGEFVLMQSHLSRLGPDYQVVSRFPFRAIDG